MQNINNMNLHFSTRKLPFIVNINRNTWILFRIIIFVHGTGEYKALSSDSEMIGLYSINATRI